MIRGRLVKESIDLDKLTYWYDLAWWRAVLSESFPFGLVFMIHHGRWRLSVSLFSYMTWLVFTWADEQTTFHTNMPVEILWGSSGMSSTQLVSWTHRRDKHPDRRWGLAVGSGHWLIQCSTGAVWSERCSTSRTLIRSRLVVSTSVVQPDKGPSALQPSHQEQSGPGQCFGALIH